MENIQARELTEHWPLINRAAARRFGDTTLAEEAALYVLDKLKENNCKRLQSFQGRSKLTTFISSVSFRLLEDFSREKFGRMRPPSWIQDLGGIWVTLFQLLCMQRLSLTEAVQTMMNRVAERKKEQVEEAALSILERVINCGSHQGLEIPDENNTAADAQVFDSEEQHNNPADQLAAQEQRIFFSLLFAEASLFSNDNSAPADVQQKNSLTEQSLRAVIRKGIQLSGEERLLLKLCFQDELPVSRAGKMLGMNANQVHGKLRRLLTRLRSDFDRAELSDEIRTLLGIV